MEWLEGLESKVKEAGRVVAALRKENRALKAKLRRLEDSRGESRSQGAAAWSRERAEIRQRVARLTEHLERLVER